MRAVSLGTSKKPPQMHQFVGGGFQLRSNSFEHRRENLGNSPGPDQALFANRTRPGFVRSRPTPGNRLTPPPDGRTLPPMASRTRHLVFYDGNCPLCRRQAARWRRLDRAGRFEFRPLQAPGPEAAAAGLAPDQLREAIHCLDRQGRVHRGAACLRFVWLRLPWLAPLGILLAVPGMLPLAELAYGWLAARRHGRRNRPTTDARSESATACHCPPKRCTSSPAAPRQP
ncbi:MAG: DUF393 domain-containing protein [Verrucomicrobia bacterium]|nr:MAG: DUF393 domain-containing protein [Verrucomicrobiota bacterium]